MRAVSLPTKIANLASNNAETNKNLDLRNWNKPMIETIYQTMLHILAIGLRRAYPDLYSLTEDYANYLLQ